MSEFLSDFIPCGEIFITKYLDSVKEQKEIMEITITEGGSLPLLGFGSTLAAACFLYDYDCFGRSGGNVGYVITTNEFGKRYAQIVKIDAGYAFTFLDNHDDRDYQHDPRQRNIRYSPSRSDVIDYAQLTPHDQEEFNQTACRILQIPASTFKALIDQVVVPGGFTRAQADRLYNELLIRRSKFIAAYPEIGVTLQQEIYEARQTLKTFLSTLVPPSCLKWLH